MIGYLDDLLLIPLGIALAIKLIPESVLEECRARARDALPAGVGRIAGAVIIAIWVLLAVLALAWAYGLLVASRA